MKYSRGPDACAGVNVTPMAERPGAMRKSRLPFQKMGLFAYLWRVFSKLIHQHGLAHVSRFGHDPTRAGQVKIHPAVEVSRHIAAFIAAAHPEYLAGRNAGGARHGHEYGAYIGAFPTALGFSVSVTRGLPRPQPFTSGSQYVWAMVQSYTARALPSSVSLPCVASKASALMRGASEGKYGEEVR